jgi:predicted PurR-regulated permease PerM
MLAGTLGAVALFLGLVVPGIAADVAGVIRELPQQLAALWATLTPWLEQRGIEVPHSTTKWTERLSMYASDVASSILAPAGNALGFLVGRTLSGLGSVAAALVVLVLAVYLLNDFDRLTAGSPS